MGRIFGQGFNIGFQIRQAFANFLQCITFNSTTSEFEDTKGNMQPVLNNVPVAVFQGDDRIVLQSKYDGFPYFSAIIRLDDIDDKYGYFIENSADTSASRMFQVRRSNANLIDAAIWDSDDNIYNVTSVNTYTQNSLIKVTCYYDGSEIVLSIEDLINNITETITNNIGEITLRTALNDRLIFGGGSWNTILPFIGLMSHIVYKNNGVEVLNYNLQEFSGNQAYDISGNGNHGTISGTGSWWTREDGIPDFNQQGCKIVEHAGGTAYVPLAISDATINSNYTSVTSITEATQDGTTLINDGALLDLHPTVSDLVVAFGDELQTNTDFTDSNSDGLADGFLAFSDTSYSIQEYDDKKFQRIEKTGSNAVVRFSGLDNSKYYQVEITGNNESSSIIGLKGDAPTDTKNISIGYNNIKFDIVKPLSGSFYIGYLGSGYFDFSIISIKQITTLSDYFTEIETASGIDHHTVQGGDPISIAYANATYIAGVKTNFGCLIPYANYVSGDELTYAMDDTLTYYGIDEYKDFAIE